MTKPKQSVGGGTTAGSQRDAVLLEQSSVTGTVPTQNKQISDRLTALAEQVSYRLRRCRGEIYNNDANVMLFESCERELRVAAVALTG